MKEQKSYLEFTYKSTSSSHFEFLGTKAESPGLYAALVIFTFVVGLAAKQKQNETGKEHKD